MSEEPTPEERRALFRVVRGEPDDVEIAALTAVLAVASSSATGRRAVEDRDRSFWIDRRAALRQPLRPGPGAWRSHFLPR
jgi:acyl-CoA carboxylase epsilon subunit